jgi:hypothetical protein
MGIIGPQFSCYVDESGDDGCSPRATPWFFVGGVIVRNDQEREARNGLDEIKETIWTSRGQKAPRLLHWQERKHQHRLAMAGIWSSKPITASFVGICKRFLNPDAMLHQDSDYLYRYAIRFLLERISWYVHEQGGSVDDLVLSNRARLDKNDLVTYISKAMSQSGSQIRPVFDLSRVKVSNPELLDMLQVADHFVSAAGNAFNPNEYGDVQPFYLERLKSRLYRRQGKLASYGLKLFPQAVNWPVADYPFLASL